MWYMYQAHSDKLLTPMYTCNSISPGCPCKPWACYWALLQAMSILLSPLASHEHVTEPSCKPWAFYWALLQAMSILLNPHGSHEHFTEPSWKPWACYWALMEAMSILLSPSLKPWACFWDLMSVSESYLSNHQQVDVKTFINNTVSMTTSVVAVM